MPRWWAECCSAHWCYWKAFVVHGIHMVCQFQFFLVCISIEVRMVCCSLLSMNNVEDVFLDSCSTPCFCIVPLLSGTLPYVFNNCLSLLCPAHNDKLTEATYNLNISLLSSNQCFNKLVVGKFAFRKLIFQEPDLGELTC